MSELINNLSTKNKPKLLDQVRTVIRTKHYSRRTEEAYIYWIKKYIFFHNRGHPKEIGEKDINAFISYIANKENVSAATQNQALYSLIFLYKYVLKQEFGQIGDFVRAKKPKRLPVVLNKDEVKIIISHLNGVPWLMVNLLCGSGLRQIECIHSIKQGNKALSFLTERSVDQESPLYTGDSCIRRNDIVCMKVSLP